MDNFRYVTLGLLMLFVYMCPLQQISAASMVNDYEFKKFLKQNARDPEVKELQKFLNANGFIVSKIGPGSPGQETDVFDIKTKNALIQFQKKNNIRPANGYVGITTRRFMNSLEHSWYYDDSWSRSVFSDIEHKDAPLPVWWIDGNWPLKTVDKPPKLVAGETPRILFWWAAYLHYYDTEKKQWFVEKDPDIAIHSYDLLSFCRRYYPKTVTVKKYKKENIPLARDDDTYVLEPSINPWSFECVQ